MLDAAGHRLAKRTQSSSLEPLRAAGATTDQIVGQLAASCGLVASGTLISASGLVQQYHNGSYDIIRARIT
jgi:hypothetical protein